MAKRTTGNFQYGYSEFGGKKHRLTKSGKVDKRTLTSSQKESFRRLEEDNALMKQDKQTINTIRQAISVLGDEYGYDWDSIKKEYLNYDDLKSLIVSLQNDMAEYSARLQELAEDDEQLEHMMPKLEYISELTFKLDII